MKEFIKEEKLQQFFNGELSPEEAGAIVDQANLSEENLKKLTASQQMHFRVRWAYRDELIKGDYSTFKKRMARRKSLWIRYTAAVAVLLTAIAGGIMLTDRFGNDNLEIANIGSPDHKPILQLSDGSRHQIDHSQVELTEKNGLRLTLDADQINYSISTNNIPGSTVEPVNNTLIVPRGAAPYQITLSDKTVVWVNSDSQIEYPVTFTGTDRRVFIRGEAYFKVAQNRQKPFIVESAGQSVEVLGTEFVVSSYPEESTLTTVVSGRVNVASAGHADDAILTSGKQSLLLPGSKRIVVSEVSVESFISWRDGILNFDRMSLDEILIVLSRRFDVDFNLKGANLSRTTLRGSVSTTEDLGVILTAIEKLIDVEFKLKANGEIMVKQK